MKCCISFVFGLCRANVSAIMDLLDLTTTVLLKVISRPLFHSRLINLCYLIPTYLLGEYKSSVNKHYYEDMHELNKGQAHKTSFPGSKILHKQSRIIKSPIFFLTSCHHHSACGFLSCAKNTKR